MDFAFSAEQEEFRDTLRRFLEENSPSSEVRRLMETREGFDRGVWKQMAGELGLQGLHIPESYGGQGFGFLELGIVQEEMGRVLFCAPYLSTVCLAASAILNAGSEAQKQALLPSIASGETVATLALVEPGGDWEPESIRLVAQSDGDGFRLNGCKTFVTDGHTADLIVVAARLEGTQGRDGITLLTLRSDAQGLSALPLDTLDLTRKQARLELRDVRAEALGEAGAAADALERTLDQGCVLLAAESAGGAARCLETAVAYAKHRVQFGRPIGSFQAIKHKCAEVLLEVESAKSAVYWASWVAEEKEEELAQAASVAKSLSSEGYLRAAAENVQIHGGIGVTWEADPQLYLKRAKTNEELLGNPGYHRARLVTALGV
ncbi:MAG: acyl-CoA/acyl-ACP dehydrogenase [Deltaproteobacteria bacterium]|nr:acyl-CoA/acyl-ACP dehydrogenase [Deltaproteobacteria bacterium]